MIDLRSPEGTELSERMRTLLCQTAELASQFLTPMEYSAILRGVADAVEEAAHEEGSWVQWYYDELLREGADS